MYSYNDDLAKKLKSTVTEDKHSFQAGMKSTVTNIIDVQIVPWLHQCFQKYPPAEFHRRMHGKYEFDGYIYDGFDYIQDWKDYHKKIFIAFKVAKRMKRYIDLDGTKLYDTITSLLTERGYGLLPHERQCIRHTIAKVMRLIYT